MEIFVQATNNDMNMHAKSPNISSIDICKQIFLHLSSYNFVPCIIVKMMM
jgi:hypothetical protein